MILLAWLLADFISGLVHWAQDSLLTRPVPIKFLESVRRENDLHHWKPTAMCKLSYSGNINTTAVFTLPLGIIFTILGFHFLGLTAAFLTFSNLIHRWAHETKPPKIVKLIQKTGFFLSFDHHFGHHYGPKGRINKSSASKRYCAMTNWLNPILDKIRFWHALETIIGRKHG